MTYLPVHYGPFPIPGDTLRQWHSEGVEDLRVCLPIHLDDLIDCGSTDALLDWADDQTEVMLTDVSYGVDYEATNRQDLPSNYYDPGTLVIWFEGAVAWDSLAATLGLEGAE